MKIIPLEKKIFLKENQPNYEKFKDMGKSDDYIFQSLVHLGDASHQVAWANTVLDGEVIPVSIQRDMREVSEKIQEIKEALRRSNT